MRFANWLPTAHQSRKKKFHIVLIKPSKYDDDGYVIRWLWGIIPSNSLACLYALTQDVADKKVFGEDVEVVTHLYDESFRKVDVKKISRHIRRSGGKSIVCMVGVQSNQYPRALDLSLEFKAEGIPSMIGGFHVSGSLAMLPETPPEIQEAIDQGITVVAGEVEDHLGELLKDAYENRMKPVYDYMADQPNLAGAPPPYMPARSFFKFLTSFDAGRGCPFKCSFCTIINVQGNTMRGRTADDIEKLVRAEFAKGVRHFFITDDNFARHKEWEAIADRLIDLKENHGIRLSLKIQADAAAHKIPNFIEKMARAGVRRVFIGMESVNTENLRAVGKYHNQLKEYRKLLQKWRDHGVLTFGGYILGFPGDTYESIMQDVECLKNELPLDFAEFFIMTPLPGSKDHQKYAAAKVPMEADMNLYDSAHICMDHPKMSREELYQAYKDAWKSFYSKEHLETLLLRRKGPRRRILRDSLIWFCSSAYLENIHPLLSGFFRRKGRKSRRRGMAIEPFFPYYAKRVVENTAYIFNLLKMIAELTWLMRKASRPENQDYVDAATTIEKEELKPVLSAAG